MNFVEAALSNEEDGLWQKVRESRDQAARNQLVELYLPFARQLASTLFARRPDNDVEFADYMQYASMGLIEAVDRYQSARGAMFRTYAGYRIKGAILNGLKTATERRNQHMAMSKSMEERLASVSPVEEELNESNLFEEMVGVTVGLALGCMLDSLATDSLQVHATESDDPYRGHAFRETCARLELAVAGLDEREQRIVRYHYYHQVSFECLADLYGVSKGRISQIHKQALCRIRSSLQSGEVMDKVY